MVYGLETVAVTKKHAEEMEVAGMKMLRFAIGETKKDKIRNEDEEGQAEVVWTCHEERPEVCKKKGDGNGVTRKSGRPKRRFLVVLKGDIREVGAREKDIENRTL